jgi:hypothetical protein
MSDAAPSSASPTAPAAGGDAAATPAAAPAAAKPTSTASSMKSVSGAGAAPEGAEAAAKEAEAKDAEAKAEAKKKWKYRANKEDVEEELSDDEVALRLSKAKGAEKAFQEAAAIKKELVEFVKALKENPFDVLKDPAFGVDLDVLARQRLAQEYERHLEEAQLTEEQREVKAAREEAERYRTELEKREAAERAAREAQVREQVEARTKATLEAALDALGIDATPEALYEAAYVMKMNLQYGLRLTPQQIAGEVRNRQNARNERFHKAVVGGNLKGERLLQYFGGPESPVVVELARALASTNSPAVKELVKARLAALKRPEPFEAPAARRGGESEASEGDAKAKRDFDRAAWRRENIYGIRSRD